MLCLADNEYLKPDNEMKDLLKDEIAVLRGMLQHRERWYLDISVSEECEELKAVAEKAKSNADKKLSSMSAGDLLKHYTEWSSNLLPVTVIKGDADEKHYDNFLSDLAYLLGEKSLKGNEKKLFQESCNLFIKFI